MSIRFLCLLLVALCMSSSAMAQNKPTRKQLKEQRKVEQFERHNTAVADTLFRFQTKKILLPYTDANWSGGYISLQGNSLRIQQLTWIDNLGKKSTLQEVTAMNSYRMETDPKQKQSAVVFDCVLRGQTYYFTITYGLEQQSTLVIQTAAGEKMIYSGRFK